MGLRCGSGHWADGVVVLEGRLEGGVVSGIYPGCQCISIRSDCFNMECKAVFQVTEGEAFITSTGSRRIAGCTGWYCDFGERHGCIQDCFLIPKTNPDIETKTRGQELEHA